MVDVEWLRPLFYDQLRWGVAIDDAKQAIRQPVDLEAILLFTVRMRTAGQCNH